MILRFFIKIHVNQNWLNHFLHPWHLLWTQFKANLKINTITETTNINPAENVIEGNPYVTYDAI